jgi:hypothetical protein
VWHGHACAASGKQPPTRGMLAADVAVARLAIVARNDLRILSR